MNAARSTPSTTASTTAAASASASPATDRADVVQRLLPLLQRDAALHGQPSEALGSGSSARLPAMAWLQTLHNPYSDVLVFSLEQGQTPHRGERIYVKVPHIGTSGPALPLQRLRAEFEMLQRLQMAVQPPTSEPGYGSVVPLGLYPEFPALATFGAAPTTLREHYRSGARRLWPGAAHASLPPAVSHCGQWLRAFQQSTHTGFGPFPADELMGYIEIRLQRLVALPGLGFSASLAQAIRHRVHAVAQTIDPATHRLCARHNDFSSHNILARESRIWVIDFSMVDNGSSAFDPTTFWLDLEMLKADTSYSSGFIRQLQAVFLQAYGGITPENPAFTLVRTQYQLNRILTLHAPLRLPTPGALYRRRVVRQCLAGLQAFAGA